MNSVVSDETLHPFIDGELDGAEREALTARSRMPNWGDAYAPCAACATW